MRSYWLRTLNAVLVGPALLLVLSCGGGGGQPDSSDSSGANATTVSSAGGAAPAASIAALKSAATQRTIDSQSFPFMIRAQAEARVPELAQLVAAGSAAVEPILAEFRAAPTLTSDVPLSLMAMALEKLGDSRAIPVLAAWLDQNIYFGSTGWTTDFVTHTLKVLQSQSGINTSTFVYPIDAKFDALLQARRVAAAVANGTTAGVANVVPHGVIDGNLTPQQKNVCPKVIRVTGIDSAGQEVSVSIGYRTVQKDANELITDQAYSEVQRQTLANRLRGWAETDATGYDSSTYRIDPDSKITDASNCGGSVTENVIRQLISRLNIPLTIGPGQGDSDEIVALARTFGKPVSLAEIDTLTVIAHSKRDEPTNVGHVEIPLSVSRDRATIRSKDNFGHVRSHQVNLQGVVGNEFDPAIRVLAGGAYFGSSGITTTMYKLDPTRIRSIVVESGRCFCDPNDPANIRASISAPTASETTERVITVSGTVGNGTANALSGTVVLVNNEPQSVAVASNGSFTTQVLLRSGDNQLRVGVEGTDGRRGCATKNIRSTTARTTISATLTWELGASDLDLYVTQPDGQTAWYNNKTTRSGGRLDVDNTSGFGPENYFITLPAGSIDSDLRNRPFSIRVHYFADRQKSGTTPTRAARWRVATLLDEGTPRERYKVFTGLLAADDRSNDQPGGSGPDWASVATFELNRP